MEIHLINPPDCEITELHIAKDMAGGFGFNAGDGVVLPPLELIYHAQTLHNEGKDVKFWDFQAENEKVQSFLRELNNKDSIYIILLTVPTLYTDLKFVKLIKDKNPRAKIWAKLDMKHSPITEKVMSTQMFEAVLSAETEMIIGKILDGQTKDGCAYLENGALKYGAEVRVSDVNQLPKITLASIPYNKYEYTLLPGVEGNTFTFQSSRGCPFPCAYYCPYPLIQGNEWRSMKVGKLFDQIKYFYDEKNVRSILFRDATFTLDIERTRNFCQMILDSKMQMHWWCETRMNCLNEELLEIMSRAGCRGINLGVETGDDELMQKQGKVGGDVEKLKQVKIWAKKYGIKLHFLMIVGLPDESKKSLYSSFQLIDKLEPESIGVTTITPYPGTPLYREAKSEGWIIDENIENYIGNKVVMKNKYLSPKQIKRGNFYLQVAGYLSRQTHPVKKIIRIFFRPYMWLWSKIYNKYL